MSIVLKGVAKFSPAFVVGVLLLLWPWLGWAVPVFCGAAIATSAVFAMIAHVTELRSQEAFTRGLVTEAIGRSMAEASVQRSVGPAPNAHNPTEAGH